MLGRQLVSQAGTKIPYQEAQLRVSKIQKADDSPTVDELLHAQKARSIRKHSVQARLSSARNAPTKDVRICRASSTSLSQDART